MLGWEELGIEIKSGQVHYSHHYLDAKGVVAVAVVALLGTGGIITGGVMRWKWSIVGGIGALALAPILYYKGFKETLGSSTIDKPIYWETRKHRTKEEWQASEWPASTNPLEIEDGLRRTVVAALQSSQFDRVFFHYALDNAVVLFSGMEAQCQMPYLKDRIYNNPEKTLYLIIDRKKRGLDLDRVRKNCEAASDLMEGPLRELTLAIIREEEIRPAHRGRLPMRFARLLSSSPSPESD